MTEIFTYSVGDYFRFYDHVHWAVLVASIFILIYLWSVGLSQFAKEVIFEKGVLHGWVTLVFLHTLSVAILYFAVVLLEFIATFVVLLSPIALDNLLIVAYILVIGGLGSVALYARQKR